MALETHNWRLFHETFNWEKPDVYMQNGIAGEALCLTAEHDHGLEHYE